MLVGNALILFMLDLFHIRNHTVDEFIFHMTHDRVVDFLLPGVPPTGKNLSIPMIAVVSVRGDRLYNGEWPNCYHYYYYWGEGTG